MLKNRENDLNCPLMCVYVSEQQLATMTDGLAQIRVKQSEELPLEGYHLVSVTNVPHP